MKYLKAYSTLSATKAKYIFIHKKKEENNIFRIMSYETIDRQEHFSCCIIGF